MSIHRIRPRRMGLALAASALAAQLLHAQPPPSAPATGGNYTMRKQFIGAGEASSAGMYRVVGSVGEPGAEESSSPRFRLIGGFHGPAGPIVDSIYCDSFEDVACP
jgi:hypothetical protein